MNFFVIVLQQSEMIKIDFICNYRRIKSIKFIYNIVRKLYISTNTHHHSVNNSFVLFLFLNYFSFDY